MIIRHYILALSAIIAALLFSACSEKNNGDEPRPPVQSVGRTVLVYMVANNNLGSGGFDKDDLNEMTVAANAGHITDGRLLVYHAGYNAKPCLVEIKSFEIDTLKVYDESAYSVSSRRMTEVLDDVHALAPADSYGMVFWSHGSGWLHDGMEAASPDRKSEPEISPYSFGAEHGRTMNISTLAEVLGNYRMDFLYFDCCYMSSVEVAYELRDVTSHIVGSATELVSSGMCYDTNVREMFRRGAPDLIAAATNTYNYYNSLSGMLRTCTMSVINTAGMDRLAEATARIYEKSSVGIPDGYSPQLFMDKSVSTCYHFDFRDYVAALAMGADGSVEQWQGAAADLAAFDEALAGVVEYSAATPKLWNRIPLTRVCGLSSYILSSSASSSTKNYDELTWFRDVASRLAGAE